MIIVRKNPERLEKAKYTKRWKGKNGKWQYQYKNSGSTKTKFQPVDTVRLDRLVNQIGYKPNFSDGEYSLKDLFNRKIVITKEDYDYIVSPKQKNKNTQESNLDDKQKKQIGTKEFKNWFGNSKVVDENGDPAIMYHGSTRVLDEIKPGVEEPGAWFTSSRTTAANYVKGDSGELHGLYLSIKNPLIVDFSEIKNDTILIEGKEFDNNVSIVEYAINKGSDGVVFPIGNFTEDDETWVAFESSQIKSAIDNSGSFDSSSNNIRKSRIVIRKSMKETHESLAKKHGVSVKHIENQIKMGEKEEMEEHNKTLQEGHIIAMDHLREDKDYYYKLKEAGLLGKSISETKFGKEFKKMFSDEEGKINIYKKRYEIKDLDNFPKALDLENCDITSLKDDKASFVAGGDWQQGVRFSIIYKNGKMIITDIFYDNGDQKKEDLKLNVKELNSMEKSKQDKVAQVMREFKEGTLASHGKPVTDRQQALAIAMSEAGMSKSKIVIRSKRLEKAKYISKKKVNNKWVYKYKEDKDKSSIKEESVESLGDINNKWKARGVNLFTTKKGDIITLESIKVSDESKEKGLATEAMKELVSFATKEGSTISLTPSSDFGANKKRLTDFYKRFGFVENKGKNKDYEISDTMYLSPNIKKSIIVRVKKAIDFKNRLISLRKRKGETKEQFDNNFKREMNNIAAPPAEYDRRYKLQGRKKLYGLDIAIENEKGSYRRGKDIDGKLWKTYMNFDYGRIGGTKAVDGEGVDIYLGPDDTAEKVYVVHQQDPFKGVYDEDKAMCGFPSRESAIEGYLSQYNRPDFLGPISEFTIPEFKTALKEKRGCILYKSPIEYNADEMRKNKPKIVIRKR